MSKEWPIYGPMDLIKTSANWHKPWHDNYYVMFSSIWGGFSTDPQLWGVPPDDHMVHRGDAVFESFKCVSGKVYCLKEHLERLANSASFLAIKMPKEFDQITEILKQAYKLGGHDDFVIRLTVSRGPGSFAVNPYDSPESQLYLVTMKLKQPAAEVYQKGVTIITAPYPAKSEYVSIKACDYLHNVLVKKAAVDAGADYAVSFDREGYLTEGPTENVALVTKTGQLIAPTYNRILKGVTLSRVLSLGEELVKEGFLKQVLNQDMTREDILNQVAEVFLTTTSFDVLGVSYWDKRPIGEGHPGPVTLELKKRIVLEIQGNNQYLTNLKS
jgi:branched-chain amino acid aminotransferase